MFTASHRENTVSDLRIVSTDFAVGLPLAHEGPYSYLCHMLARPASDLSVSLIPFSKETAVKVFRSNDEWEKFPALLLDQHGSKPAAFVHKHITPFIFVDVHEISASGTRSTKAMVTEWYGQGDVLTYLRRNPSASRIALAVQVSKALEHLHSFDIIHGNIYPGNIFVTDEGHATVTDISVHTLASQALFRLQPDAPFPLREPSSYQPPESLSAGTDISMERAKAMDVYSFASTIFAIFIGRTPLCEPNPEEDLLGRHFNINSSINEIICDELRQLLGSCWARDPVARPSMSQVADTLDDIELYH